MSIEMNRIRKSFDHALHLSMTDHPRIVIMADCHRGCGTWADSFLNNRPIFTAALKYYYSNQFTYIELGDGDELWENRRFTDIYHTHREIYDIFYEFHQRDRLFMVFGNHDRIKENSAYVWNTPGSQPIPFYESIIIDDGLQVPLFMFHGYQGDFLNDQAWKFSRWLVRYLWRPLELRGVKDPTSAAKNYTRLLHTEDRFIRYSCLENCIVITGHTHKPTLMQTDCGMYFNCGSCVHPNTITAIELSPGKALLVKWSICSHSDLSLYVCREILKEMPI